MVMVLTQISTPGQVLLTPPRLTYIIDLVMSPCRNNLTKGPNWTRRHLYISIIVIAVVNHSFSRVIAAMVTASQFLN